MKKTAKVKFGALNIKTHPHPTPEIYANLIEFVHKKELIGPLRGHTAGRIDALFPISSNNRLAGYTGKIGKWTRIDNVYSKQKEKFFTQEEVEKLFPGVEDAQALPNYERSDFVFYPEKHKLIFVSYHNHAGHRQHLTPGIAGRLFDNLFNHPTVQANFHQDVEVVVIPDNNVLERILNLYDLQKIEICVNRPNKGDDLEDDDDIVFNALNRIHVKEERRIYKAAKGQSIDPDEEMKRYARVAADNGFVKAIGKDEYGNRVEESTVDKPLLETLEYDAQKESLGSNLLSLAAKILGLL